MSQPYPSTRPPEDTMAAYHARTPSYRTTRPSESTMAAYHAGTPPHGEHDPHQTSHTLSRRRSFWTTWLTTKTPWPLTLRKAPLQRKTTLDASHGRIPGTANIRRTP